MSSIVLELVTSPHSSYEQGLSIHLDLVTHVHRRVERFKYLNEVKPVAVALDYIDTEELDSWKNLQIVNRTYTIPANSYTKELDSKVSGSTLGIALSSIYKDIIISNQLGTDLMNQEVVMFWKHKLPVNTVSCKVEKVSRGNSESIVSGYKIVLNNNCIYTNLKNSFNLVNGDYEFYFVSSIASDGTSSYSLLNPVPVAQEATWEDIDLDTGRLIESSLVFSREKSSNGYLFSMSKADVWYYQPFSQSIIQPQLPSGRTSEEPWYLKFTLGEFSALTNSQMRRYWLPEYDQQSFSPYKPYIYSPYENMIWVNSYTLASNRKNIAIDPEAGLHITIFIKDYQNNLIRVLTTDGSLENKRYGNTSLFYEYGEIKTWDNREGFVVLNSKIESSYSFSAKCHYKSLDVEYKGLNLNPLYNKNIEGKIAVFYMVPNADQDDQSLQHLIVDSDGIIVECSQTEGFFTPNLQVLNSDGTYNPNTVIGKKYVSEIFTDTFVNRYSVGYDNSNAYYILAEVVLVSTVQPANAFVCSVRKPGGFLNEEYLEEAFVSNPKLVQSVYGYGEEGQEIPKNKVVIIRAPLSLLEDYGGTLTQSKAEEFLTKHLESSVLPVFEWEYPKSVLACTSDTAGEVELSWSWEGPNQTYYIYRQSSSESEWEELDSISGGTTPTTLSYTDLDVVAGEFYSYCVRIEESDILYPRSYSIKIKVSS